MIQARIHQGRIEVQDPIPEDWEGQFVKIAPLTPDDPLPDLEARLAALHALGLMEFEPEEKERIAASLEECNRLGKAALQALAGGSP